MRIAVDWDGVIANGGDWVPGAVQALRILLRQKHHLVIHSCRGNYPAGREMVAAKLNSVRLNDIELWDRPGKPDADVYIDDRALRFVDWPSTLKHLRSTP